MPPFLRQDPNWMEEKLSLVMFYIKLSVSKQSPQNTAVGSSIEIRSEDLGTDKVHLNDSGKEKLHGVIQSDILKVKESCSGEDDDMMETNSQLWSSQLSNSTEPPTPATLKKRQRTDNEDEGEEEVELLIKC